MDVKGTGAITDMADNVLVCWRNKRKESKRNDRPDGAAEDTMRAGGDQDDDQGLLAFRRLAFRRVEDPERDPDGGRQDQHRHDDEPNKSLHMGFKPSFAMR